MYMGFLLSLSDLFGERESGVVQDGSIFGKGGGVAKGLIVRMNGRGEYSCNNIVYHGNCGVTYHTKID